MTEEEKITIRVKRSGSYGTAKYYPQNIAAERFLEALSLPGRKTKSFSTRQLNNLVAIGVVVIIVGDDESRFQ